MLATARPEPRGEVTVSQSSVTVPGSMVFF
jgi:hypothetical protein